MSPRAQALPPDERRAAIIAATRPLMRAHGAGYTTKQVAEAAGIAEGTVFRAFTTKDELTAAVLDDLMDPRELCEGLAAIDRTKPLGERVETAIQLLVTTITEASQVFVALAQQPGSSHQNHQKKCPDKARRHAEHGRRLDEALVRVLADEPSLRTTPARAAALIRSVAFGAAHPAASPEATPSPAQLADLVLHGLTTKES